MVNLERLSANVREPNNNDNVNEFTTITILQQHHHQLIKIRKVKLRHGNDVSILIAFKKFEENFLKISPLVSLETPVRYQ